MSQKKQSAIHGDEFNEHGQIGHERSVYREVPIIPMLIAGPGLVATRLDAPVGLPEVAPSILDLAGVEPSRLMAGDRDGSR